MGDERLAIERQQRLGPAHARTLAAGQNDGGRVSNCPMIVHNFEYGILCEILGSPELQSQDAETIGISFKFCHESLHASEDSSRTARDTDRQHSGITESWHGSNGSVGIYS